MTQSHQTHHPDRGVDEGPSTENHSDRPWTTWPVALVGLGLGALVAAVVTFLVPVVTTPSCCSDHTGSVLVNASFWLTLTAVLAGCALVVMRRTLAGLALIAVCADWGLVVVGFLLGAD